MKKSAFKTMAEAINSDHGLKNFNLPTSRVDRRRLTVDEIKEHIMEEFGKVKDSSEVDSEENPKGWGDADLAHEIDWIKSLDLKEALSLLVKEKDKASK